MKKIFFAMPLLALALTACDPSQIEGGSEWASISADQVQATATPVQVDGKNSNRIHVTNTSPVVSAWDADQLIENTTHTVTTDGEIYVTKIGQNVIRCLTTNVGGTPTTKELTVQVDKNKSQVKHLLLEGAPSNTLEIVKNDNPCLCTFHWNDGKLEKNLGQISTFSIGEYELLVDWIDAAGNHGENVSLGKFKIEAMEVPEGVTLLTGYTPENPTATKTWELVPANNWGNGGNNDKKPSWWTTSVVDQGGSLGSITFDFANSTLTKVVYDESNKAGDKSGSGVFSLDFTTADDSKSILFTLKTTEPGNIIYPVMINQGDYHPTVYDVTVVSENELVLRAQHTNDATWEGCFWVFQAVK